jgi:chromate transport protein ChrA
MVVVFSIVGAAIFVWFNEEQKSIEDYLLISLTSVICSLVWPVEIIVGLVFITALWVNSIKKQIEEKRRNENKR